MGVSEVSGVGASSATWWGASSPPRAPSPLNSSWSLIRWELRRMIVKEFDTNADKLYVGFWREKGVRSIQEVFSLPQSGFNNILLPLLSMIIFFLNIISTKILVISLVIVPLSSLLSAFSTSQKYCKEYISGLLGPVYLLVQIFLLLC